LGIVGICGEFQLISGFPGIARGWPVFFGICRELWTISVFDAGSFGVSADFLGMERG